MGFASHEFNLPPSTKSGTVLALTREEWESLVQIDRVAQLRGQPGDWLTNLAVAQPR